MSAFLSLGFVNGWSQRHMALATVVEAPAARGQYALGGLTALELHPLPEDSIGTMQLTLLNVVVGSTYNVEVVSTGAKVLTGVVQSPTFTISIPIYVGGNPRNELRLKVRKASEAPYYQALETQVIASSAPQSIFINQLSDE